MQNPIKQIHAWNKQAGLLESGYSDKRECSFPIEEALEGFDLKWLSRDLHDDDLNEQSSAKDISRSIIASARESEIDISDVDRFDKHLDILVFSFGSLFKLGLSPQDVMHGLSIVAEANMQKLHAGKDSQGKQMKPKDFVSPEPELQKILDRREIK